MTAQHTPGPWVANEDGLVYSTNARLGKHNVICAVHPTDAALIAAAPALLAALLDFVAASEAIASGDTSMNLPWGTARAAIAKARDTQ